MAGRPHVCILGLQWGDEGKGKAVDVLTPEFDAVVRFQGGANAGHTVQIDDAQFILHLVPSGILRGDKICVIGNGVVIEPRTLVEEIDQLRSRGIDSRENLWISDRAHLVMPYHLRLDAARERGAGRIGTTLRGIGPCYTDKARRIGIRTGDLLDPERFRSVLEGALEENNRILVELYGEEPVSFQEVYDAYLGYGERFRDRITNTAVLLDRLHRAGQRILFEGAQGAMLDVDMGTYPYVTSSNTSVGAVAVGSGFSPRRIGQVWGVTKAYTTRVGGGPFPSEIKGDLGDRIRQQGAEYGATTGRPRRCGWLDLVALKHALLLNDVDRLILTKLDVLDELGEIQVCLAYRTREGELEQFPPALPLDGFIEPVYRTFPGWGTPTRGIRSFEGLPANARSYIEFIEEATGVRVVLVSVGNERSQVLRRDA